MKLKIISFLLIPLFLLGCEEVTNSSPDRVEGSASDWLIPQDQVFDGGPGKDGIPALTNPQLVPANSISYLNNNDLVLAIKMDDEIRVYPHPILDWHEIINDGINENKFAVTYCPLTGSGIALDRKIGGNETTFGVSGLLYNTNLIPYDRATDSYWSQMKMMSINGQLIGEDASVIQLIETTWQNIKSYFSDAKVVSTNTGHSRNYNNFPYGDYKTNHDFLLFPVSHDDSRLPRKERVLGVLVNGTAKAFRFSSDELSLKESVIEGKNIVVVSGKNRNLITAFQTSLEGGDNAVLSLVNNQMPVILKDQKNNQYDFFGEVISGPDQGKKLKYVPQFIAYWFAWAAFYPETSLE